MRKLTVVNKQHRKAELRPLKEVIAEITKIFDRDGISGVQGFVINVRTPNSQMRLSWGDTRPQRLKR